MLRNLVSIYLFGAVLLTSFFCTYFLSKSKARHVKMFSLFAFSLSIYILGYVLEINSFDLSQMEFWNQVQYFPIPFITTLMLIFTILFTKKDYEIKKIQWIFLFFIPVLTFFIRLTNPVHGFYYTGMDVVEISGIRLLLINKGIWYYVQQAHSLTTIVIAIVLLVSKIKTNKSSENKQFQVLILAAILPILGIVLIIFNFFNNGLDYVTILLPFSILLMNYAVLKYDFLEIKTKAREASFENSPDGLILLDTHYRVMDFNKTAKFIFPLLENIKGTCRVEEIAADDKSLIKVFKDDSPNEFIMKNEESEFHYDITSSAIYDIHSKPVGFLKTLRDITENNKIKNQMKALATIDSLSGIFNRNHFFAIAEKKIQNAIRSGETVTFIMMDIDKFKSINDKWGHGAGDAIIREFGNLLKSVFDGGVVGRVGGEEFAALMPGYDIEKGRDISEHFRLCIENLEVEYDKHIIKTTVSIGVSSSESVNQNIEELMKKADKCMYLAKYKGRNRVEVNQENLS